MVNTILAKRINHIVAKGGQSCLAKGVKVAWLFHGSMQKRKNGELRQNKANERLSTMASFYKSMALKKVGSRIRIPKRQYMGESATFMKQLDTWIASEIDKRFSNI